MKILSQRLLALSLAAALVLTLASCGGQQAESTSSEAPVWIETEGYTYPFYNPLTEPPSLTPLPPPVPAEKATVEQISTLFAQNKDAVGWLRVPGTTINDAILQGPNNSKYLRANNLGQYAFEGCYFLDFRNTLKTAANLDKNSIIYGHNLGNPQNMKDDPNGDKFAQLLKFANVEFAKENPYFYVTTPTETLVFKIFTAFYTETKFYYIETKFPDSASFLSLVDEARLRSEHRYDVDVGSSDRVMTLSTCTYKYGSGYVNHNQRFVVMGRLLRASETDQDIVPVTPNPSPKAPTF